MAESTEATARALMVLVEDMREFEEIAERIRVQVEALAARHGVSLRAEREDGEKS